MRSTLSEAIRLLVNPRPITTPITSSAFWRWIRVILLPFGAFRWRTRVRNGWCGTRWFTRGKTLEPWRVGIRKRRISRKETKKIAVIPHQVACFSVETSKHSMFSDFFHSPKNILQDSDWSFDVHSQFSGVFLGSTILGFQVGLDFWASRWVLGVAARHTSLLEPVWSILVGPKLQVRKFGVHFRCQPIFLWNPTAKTLVEAGPAISKTAGPLFFWGMKNWSTINRPIQVGGLAAMLACLIRIMQWVPLAFNLVEQATTAFFFWFDDWRGVQGGKIW